LFVSAMKTDGAPTGSKTTPSGPLRAPDVPGPGQGPNPGVPVPATVVIVPRDSALARVLASPTMASTTPNASTLRVNLFVRGARPRSATIPTILLAAPVLCGLAAPEIHRRGHIPLNLL